MFPFSISISVLAVLPSQRQTLFQSIAFNKTPLVVNSAWPFGSTVDTCRYMLHLASGPVAFLEIQWDHFNDLQYTSVQLEPSKHGKHLYPWSVSESMRLYGASSLLGVRQLWQKAFLSVRFSHWLNSTVDSWLLVTSFTWNLKSRIRQMQSQFQLAYRGPDTTSKNANLSLRKKNHIRSHSSQETLDLGAKTRTKAK